MKYREENEAGRCASWQLKIREEFTGLKEKKGVEV